MGNRSSRIRSSSQPPRTEISSGDYDPKLPEDVVVEVLKRLPVASLLRFRCVCRSWRSTVEDPRFVALHLSHSALDASNWHIVCGPIRGLCSLLPHAPLALPSKSQIEMPFADPPNRYYFDGSCDGLICVTELFENGYYMSIYLWNLFTREHKVVPRSGLESKFLFLESKFFSVENTHVALGFGFDARSNDHKILRILYLPDDQKPRVEVYSLSTDSWKSLDCGVPGFCAYRSSVFLNGNLHWFVTKHVDPEMGGGYGSIVLFDFASEVFDKMALSEELLSTVLGSSVVCVSALNGLLALCTVRGEPVRHPERHSVCSVWVMREFGMPESWTELYTFEACGLISSFDGFTKNGQLLMKIIDEARVSWNPITGQFANLPLSTGCNLVTVVESLVPL